MSEQKLLYSKDLSFARGVERIDGEALGVLPVLQAIHPRLPWMLDTRIRENMSRHFRIRIQWSGACRHFLEH
jgi:hypothetical protein